MRLSNGVGRSVVSLAMVLAIVACAGSSRDAREPSAPASRDAALPEVPDAAVTSREAPRDAARDARDLAHWKVRAESVRGLAFREPVELIWIDRDRAQSLIRRELGVAFTPEFARDYGDAYAALGVLDPDIDVLASLVSLYTRQLVGLYSTIDRRMYARSDVPAADAGVEIAGLIVHELVHALQHQHFRHTLELMQALRHNDDVVSALGAAVEGDASFAMLGAPDGIPTSRDVAGAERVRDSLLSELAQPTGAMAQVPRLLRVSLAFPYAHGTVYAARRHADGGNRALDRVLEDPPLSTLHVIDPDLRDAVEFVRLPFDVLEEPLEERHCSVGHHSSAGVLTIGVLFDDHGASRGVDALLRQWRGDRFVQLDCSGRAELVWLTRWRTPADAVEFARRYREIASSIAERAGLGSVPHVLVEGRTALVLTPGLYPMATLLRERSEVRAYASFRRWVADDCFPESPCPKLPGR